MGAGMFQPGIDYMIFTALNEGFAMDISQSPLEKGKIIIYEKHGKENQRFRLRQVQGGKYQILTKTGKCLEVPKDKTKDKVQILTNDINNAPNEFWDIIPAKGGKDAFYIKTFCGKALDVEGAKAKNNVDVIQYEFHGDANQIWHIKPA